MEYIRIFIRVTCVLLIVGNIHCEIIEELLSKISENFKNIDQSYEKSFDASINKINERLDRIENVLGINDQDLEGIRKGEAIWADIQTTKHSLLQAFKIQKRHLKKVASEYEDRFEELKQGVKDMMSEMNDTVVDTTQKVNEKLLQNSNNLNESLNELETKTDGQFREVSSKIDIISHGNTMNNKDMALYQQATDEKFISLQNKQSQHDNRVRNLDTSISSLKDSLYQQGTKVRTLDSTVSSLRSNLSSTESAFSMLRSGVYSMEAKHSTKLRALDNRVLALRSGISSTESAVSSLRSSINALEETKIAFSVFLKSTKQYDGDQVIIFDGVIRNNGNGYSTSTGMFTAPKSGTYLFSLSIEGTHKENAFAYIRTYKDGSKAIWGQAHAEKDVDVTASNSIIYYLSHGEQIWAESGASCEFYLYRTSFMGVLLD